MRLYLRQKEYLWIIRNALERTRLAVYCGQVSKLQLLYGLRKSPLDIKIMEFC